MEVLSGRTDLSSQTAAAGKGTVKDSEKEEEAIWGRRRRVAGCCHCNNKRGEGDSIYSPLVMGASL